MKKNNFKIEFGIFIFIAILFLGSCNEEPTNMGMNFLPDTVSITNIAGDGGFYMNDSNYAINLPSNNTGAILVGGALNMRAASFLRFDFPSGLGWIEEKDIVSSQLFIFPKHYALGDTLGSNLLSFDIKQIVNRWTFEETTAKDVFGSDKLYAPEPLASWRGNIVYKDTTSRDTLDTIAIDMPKKLCVDWFKKRNVVPDENTPDSLITWGLALLPKDECTVINQFKGAGGRRTYGATSSMMRVLYKKKLDNGKDTTITLDVYAGVSTKFVELKEQIPEKQLVAQGGIKLHSKLKFDITKIPELAAVNFAEITLTLNEEKSYAGNEVQDSLILGIYTEPEKEKENKNVVLFCKGRRKKGTNQFIFRSAEPMFMYFLTSGKKEGSLILMQASHLLDANSLNRFVFYGADAKDEKLRPKIKLVYSYLAPNNK